MDNTSLAVEWVLASGSPRRAKILADQGVMFRVVCTNATEVSYPGDPMRTVCENARRKALAYSARAGEHVISADTIVTLDNRILGKPRDYEEAKAYLRLLSGRTHAVYTAVALDGEVRVEKSEVTFRTLDEATIASYVDEVKPLDRAGAYDIDVQGARLIASYTGSYENIMGLPLEPLAAWGVIRLKKNC